MATGASNADLAILLVDARKGLLTQTRRHADHRLAARHPPCRAGGQQDRPRRFRRSDLSATSSPTSRPSPRRSDFQLDRRRSRSRRASATTSRRAARARPGTRGRTLLDHLERDRSRRGPRAARRSACRCNGSTGRTSIFAALPARSPSGAIQRGRRDRRRHSGRQSVVTRILAADGDASEAEAGDAVTLTLADEVDIARGDVLAQPDSRPEVADQFTAHLIWMSAEPLLPGRSYLHEDRRAHDARLGDRAQAPHRRQHARQARGQDAGAQRGRLLQSRDDDAGRLRRLCRQPRDRRLHPDRPRHQRDGGGGHDRARPAPRDQHPSPGLHRRRARRARAIKHQRPAVLWFTGLSGAGKSTIANLVEAQAASRAASTPRCSTATMCATGSTRISASPPPTGSRTSAASPRSRG